MKKKHVLFVLLNTFFTSSIMAYVVIPIKVDGFETAISCKFLGDNREILQSINTNYLPSEENFTNICEQVEETALSVKAVDFLAFTLNGQTIYNAFFYISANNSVEFVYCDKTPILLKDYLTGSKQLNPSLQGRRAAEIQERLTQDDLSRAARRETVIKRYISSISN